MIHEELSTTIPLLEDLLAFQKLLGLVEAIHYPGELILAVQGKHFYGT